MSAIVHPSAILGKNIELGNNVSIGPYVVIEDNVTIGDGTSIGSHTLIGSNTSIGKNGRIFNGNSIGTIAQDLKYNNEEASLTIGDNAFIREFCTINKGTVANAGVTKIGDNCALLAYGHIAHDCVVGDNFIASNNFGAAGHTIIENNVTSGAYVMTHQFVKIGAFSFLGAQIFVKKDIIPFSLVGGNSENAAIAGINKIGLERNGFDEKRRGTIKRAFRTLFMKGLTLDEALIALAENFSDSEDVKQILAFIANGERGLCRMGD